MMKWMKQGRGRSRRRKRSKEEERGTQAVERTAREREREREKWGYGCQAFEVLRALMEIYFRPVDGGIMFLRNACCVCTQTAGFPDGMSACSRVWRVGVQAVKGAAVGLTISVVSGGLRRNRQRAFLGDSWARVKRAI